MNKTEYVKALRELADYVEARPFPDKWTGWLGGDDDFDSPKLEIRVNSKEEFGLLCAAMGSYEKERDSFYTGAVTVLSNTGAKIRVYADRDVVCKKLVVGYRTIEATPEQVVAAKPERREEIIEWECPESFLALKPVDTEVKDESSTEVSA